MIINTAQDLERARDEGLVELGSDVVIEFGVELGHPTRSGEQVPVVIGDGTHIRSGTILYSGVRFGARSATGHHVVVRENTVIGDRSVLGTGVKVEMSSTIGNDVLVETQSHITGAMTIEDFVFIGVGVITTNDVRMLHRRTGAGERLEGPTIGWGARIGSGAILLPGVQIGREAIVAVGCVVNRDIPANSVAAGNPARILGPAPDDEPVVVP